MKTDNWVDVFQNKTLNKTLRKDGIVKFALPNFDASTYTTILSQEVDGYPHEFESAFYGSVEMPDLAQKRKIDSQIQASLTPILNGLLVNHRVLTYFFLIKGIGNQSVLNLHQDWSIVDEQEHRAYNLWIPLSDSTQNNGALRVAKGTHRLPLNIRGGGIPPKFNKHFSVLEDYMEAIEVNAGEALIFDARLLHYSPSNITDKSRTAIVSNIIPTSAETVCFHGSIIDDEFIVTRYAVPADLYIHYTDFNQQKDDPNPKGVLTGKIDYGNTEPVSQAEFIRLLKATSTKKKHRFSLFR